MKIRLLGSLEIVDGTRRLGPSDFAGVKPKQLIEILLTKRGRPVPKDQIAEQLWPEEMPHDAEATIETYVSLVRRRLEPGVQHAKDCHYLLTERPGYRLDVSSAEVDVDRFEALIADGQRARAMGDLEGASHLFANAVDLYRGDYLEDEPAAPWTTAPRERLRRAFVDLLVRAGELALARGTLDDSLRLAKRAAEADPIREEAARLWMLGAYAVGRQDEALRVYDRFKRSLAQELGVDPAAATRELHQRIVRGIPVQQLLSKAVSPRGGPADAPLEMPFLGREPEMAALEKAWRDTASEGVLVSLVEGEPGIGKSRLVAEFLRRAALRCGQVKCSQLEREIPFSALAASLADLLHSLSPDTVKAALAAGPSVVELLPEMTSTAGEPPRIALPPEAARIRLLDSVALSLRAIAPSALFIDDLQWTDASSIQALGRILQRSAKQPIFLLATLRPAEASENPVATQWIEMAREVGRLRRISLEPLPRSALDALLSWGADPAELWATTGGHPLFLAERLQAGKGQRLEDAILSRYRASDPTCQRLLAAASVLEREFSSDVLTGIAGEDRGTIVQQVEDLLRRRLLIERAGALSFPHDLVRQAVYESISAPQRAAFHRAALETLAAEGAPPAELAHHALLSALSRPAIIHSTQAGQRATELFANAEAATHFERAIGLLREHPGLAEAGQLESLLIQHARALTVLGRTDEAASALETARALAKGQGDVRLELEATHWLARAHWAAWTPSRALPHARKALELAQRLNDRRLVGRGHAFLANPHGSLGENDEALRHVTQALGIYEELGEDPPAEVLYRLALIRHQRGDESGALEAVQRGEAFALAQHDETVIVFVRWVRALALASLGRYQEALNALAAAESAGKGEEAVARSRIPNTYGAFFADLGLWDEALDRDFESLDVINSITCPVVKEPRMHALLNLAEDHLTLGDPDKAAKEIAEVVRLMPEAEYGRFRYRNRLYYVQGLLALAWEEPSSALQAAETCLAEAATYQMPKYEVRGRLVKGRALAVLGERRAAGMELTQAAQLAEQLRYPAWTWRTWEALARLTRSSASAARASQSVKRLAQGLEGQLRDRFLRSATK